MYYHQSPNIWQTRRSVLRIIVLAAGVVALGWALFLDVPAETPTASAGLVQHMEIPEYEEWVPDLPVRLVIPTIGVDAPVQYVGLDQGGTGEMAVPSNFTDVGWYKHGVRPGMHGSAVIAGHLNGKDIPEAVFYDLETLQVGDEVLIMNAERIQDIFVVVKIATYDYDAATNEVFQSTDNTARLNLITCGGEWLAAEQVYDERTVVFTELATDVE